MATTRKIVLRFHSNIKRFEVTVYDGCTRFPARTTSGRVCLCFLAQAPLIRIVARPTQAGYSTTLYYYVDVSGYPCQNLYLPFAQDLPAPSPPTALNTFTLTDATYGLPIDGTLLFNGT